MSHTLNIDYQDSIDVMQEKALKYLREIRLERYNIILNFLNSMLPSKLPSLQHRLINLEGVTKKQNVLKEAYIENAELFKLKFKVNFEVTDLTSKTFVSHIAKCLKTIGYKLTKTKIESKTLYKVVDV